MCGCHPAYVVLCMAINYWGNDGNLLSILWKHQVQKRSPWHAACSCLGDLSGVLPQRPLWPAASMVLHGILPRDLVSPVLFIGFLARILWIWGFCLALARSNRICAACRFNITFLTRASTSARFVSLCSPSQRPTAPFLLFRSVAAR